MVDPALCQTAPEYWDLVPAIVGGIIGALAGGLPAWLLAKRQSDETLKRDREARVDTQKSLAFSSGVKLLHIINSTIGLSNHVESCLAIKSDPARKHMESWQVLIPMVGHTDEGSIRFTSEEMGVLASAGEYDFMQDMMLLALRHASAISAFQSYCQMRNDFRSIGPKPQDFDGQIGGGYLNPEEINSYKPYTIPLNSLADGLSERLREDIKLARNVSERFGEATKKHFKVEKFMDLTFPSDDELSSMRKPQI
jgi:hypothetical protein